VFLRVLLILLLLGSRSLWAQDLPAIQQGFLDLRQADLNSTEPIDLVGEWEFYWDRLLSADELNAQTAPKTFRQVPLPWSESRPGYPAYPAFGKATYRLRILLPPDHSQLMLRIPETFSSYNIFINGARMKVPTEAGPDIASSKTTRRTVYVPLDSTLHELDIVFQVANYISGTGGVWRSMHLGNTEAIMDVRSAQQFQMLMAACALGVMGVYHFILFLFRRDHLDNLWFSLFCFMIFTRSFFVGNDLMIYNLVDEFDWTFSRRIEFASFYLAVCLSVVFVRELFPQDMKGSIVHGFILIIGLATLAVFVLPHVQFRKTLLPMQITGIAAILYCLVSIACAVRRHRPQARTMMAGFLMMSIGTIHDILNSMFRFATMELASVGVIGCVVTLSIVISKRFSMAFDQLREAQEAIRVHNEQLDQLVKEKTLDIRSVFANIPQAIFAFQRGGYLNAEVSDYFRELFHPEPLMRATDLLQRIFAQSQLSSDQIDQITNAVDFCLDGNLLSFQLNQHVFPHHLIRSMNGQRRSFELDWNPIVDESGHIQKLLICMRDTTELTELRMKSLESEKRVKIVAELLDRNHQQIMTWLEQAIQELQTSQLMQAHELQTFRDRSKDVLRWLHTQKGNARGLGLVINASSIHACEQQVLDILEGHSPLRPAEILGQLLHELMFTRDILKSLGARPQGGSGAGSAPVTLCACITNALQQLDALALRLHKAIPEIQGLDRLQSQHLRLTATLDNTLRGALNHLLSNIMDHGLEAREERLRLGKPERGQIAFHLLEAKDRWILQLTDDGLGLPRQFIEQRLRRAGRPVPKDPHELAQVLLESGFSTRDDVNDISGRGIGLDAVAAALEAIGGRFTIATRERSDAEPQLIFGLELPKRYFKESEGSLANSNVA
jgi:hypothetical protein